MGAGAAGGTITSATNQINLNTPTTYVSGNMGVGALPGSYRLNVEGAGKYGTDADGIAIAGIDNHTISSLGTNTDLTVKSMGSGIFYFGNTNNLAYLNQAGDLTTKGHVLPETDDTRNLGAQTLRWSQGYIREVCLGTGTASECRDEWPSNYWTLSGNNLFPNETAWNVGLGVSNPSHKLELATHTTAAGGIGFGTDVELYRGAANRLDLAAGDSLNLISGNLMTASGNINVLTTTSTATNIRARGMLLGSSYDSLPLQNEIRTTLNQPLTLNARGTGIIRLQTADTTQVTVANNGNVGIGVTAPAHRLELGTHTTAAGGIGFGTDVELYRGDANRLDLAAGDSFHLHSGNLLTSSSVINVLNTSGTAMNLRTRGILLGSSYDSLPLQNEIRTSANQPLNLNARGTGSINLQTADTTKVTVTNAGNVGIGTATPAQRLDVAGMGLFNGFEIGENGQNLSSALIDQDIYLNYADNRANLRLGGAGENKNMYIYYNGGWGDVYHDRNFPWTSWILNQNLAQQNPGNFWIGGVGRVDGNLLVGDRILNPFGNWVNIGQNLAVQGGLINSPLGNLSLQAGGSTAVTVESGTGNVGIGTTAPTRRLDVDGALAVGTEGIYDRDDGEIDIRGDLRVHGHDVFLNSTRISDSVSASYLNIRPQNNRMILYDGVNNMTLDVYNAGTRAVSLVGSGISYINSGNVGIGTTAPGQRLAVNGNLRLQGGARYLMYSGGDGYIRTETANTHLYVQTGGTATRSDRAGRHGQCRDRDDHTDPASGSQRCGQDTLSV
jgi:hypothetical protein